MAQTHKQYILDFLRNGQGDDLERAKMAFGRLTPEQMNEQYGQSEQTCAEILRGYEEQRHTHVSAIEWFKKVG